MPGRWAPGSTGTEGPSPMGSVVAWPPPRDHRLSARHPDETVMGTNSEGSRTGRAGVPSPSLGPGARAEAQATVGPWAPSHPRLFLNIHLAERGSWDAKASVHILANSSPQRTAARLPGPGPGAGGQAGPPWPPGGPACPWPPSPASPRIRQCPGTQESGRPLSQGAEAREEGWERVQPTSPVSTLVPPDCPLLGWSQTLPKSLSEAFWGKELGGLGFVF